MEVGIKLVVIGLVDVIVVFDLWVVYISDVSVLLLENRVRYGKFIGYVLVYEFYGIIFICCCLYIDGWVVVISFCFWWVLCVEVVIYIDVDYLWSGKSFYEFYIGYNYGRLFV